MFIIGHKKTPWQQKCQVFQLFLAVVENGAFIVGVIHKRAA
jgi:hypothetical protein